MAKGPLGGSDAKGGEQSQASNKGGPGHAIGEGVRGATRGARPFPGTCRPSVHDGRHPRPFMAGLGGGHGRVDGRSRSSRSAAIGKGGGANNGANNETLEAAEAKAPAMSLARQA